MTRIAFSENFLIKRSEVLSDRTLDRIDAMLYTIEGMPGVGSSLVAPSLKRRYGLHVLKAVVKPYLILYRYDRQNDIVYVYDLVNARSIH